MYEMTYYLGPCYHAGMNGGTSYYRCRNCGRYLSSEKTEMDQFCSLECARQYRRCPVCGSYFLPDTDTPFCSTACAEAKVRMEDEVS